MKLTKTQIAEITTLFKISNENQFVEAASNLREKYDWESDTLWIAAKQLGLITQ